jgi:SPP1 family predicted phage head-tail adaptor
MIKQFRTIASRLKSQLLLEEESLISDGLGGQTSTWNTVATLWAEISPISGKEQLFASQLNSSVRYRLMLRYRGEVTTRMRLRDDTNNRIFNIRSVINVEEKKQLIEILADVTRPS